MVWGAIIGAGASLLGSALSGVMGSNNAAAANAANREVAQMNIDMQREFAQHGVRWKADDARAAGIHPAFAMGAQTHSFSPVAYNHQTPDTSYIARMGQDVGRAASAAITAPERQDKLMSQTAQALTLNRMGLENELLQAQIAKTRGQIGPPFPSFGQRSPGGGNSGDAIQSPMGTYELKPNEITTHNPADASVTAGPAGPQNQWKVAGPGGAIQGFPDPQVIQDQEITNPLMIRWMLTQGWRKPPMNIAPKGAVDWQWTPSGWVPIYGGGSGGSFLGPRISRTTSASMPPRSGTRGAYIGRPW